MVHARNESIIAEVEKNQIGDTLGGDNQYVFNVGFGKPTISHKATA